MQRIFFVFLAFWLAMGCTRTPRHVVPSSLLAYNDAAEAARLGEKLGAQPSANIGRDIQLQTTDGPTLRVRPNTIVYLKDTQGTVHRFSPPFEVKIEGDTLSITRENEPTKAFQRAEIADVYVML